MVSDAHLSLPISMRGRVHTYYFWLGATAYAVLLAVGAVALLGKSASALTECLADGLTVGTIGGLLALASLEYLDRALTAVPNSKLASEGTGSVRVEGELMTLRSPGVLAEPFDVHRSWVEGIVDHEPSNVGTDHIAYLNLSTHAPTTYIVLSGPLGLPCTRIKRNIGVITSVQGLPGPCHPVRAIALDLEKHEVANEELRKWLTTTDVQTDHPLPALPPPKTDWRPWVLLGSALLLVCVGAIGAAMSC